MSEQNKALLRRIMDELWQKGNLDIVDECFAPNYVNHNALPGMPSGSEGVKASSKFLASAFSDSEVIVDDQIAEGDRIVTRWTSHGTHSGEFMGIPATGKRVTVSGIDIVRIAGGKVVEGWSKTDMAGLMQQLGGGPPRG